MLMMRILFVFVPFLLIEKEKKQPVEILIYTHHL